MHPTRYVIRPAATSCGGRAAAARCGAPYGASRGFAHWAQAPSSYGRFSPQADFGSLLRLFDDASVRAFDNFFPALVNQASSARTYQPRFDIREVDNAYELRGELPGVQGENLSVEFTDPQTLIIKGRTERDATSGTPPTATNDTLSAAAVEAETSDNASDTASVLSSSSYQKPSVEDGEPEVAESSTAGAATPATSAAPAVTTEAQQETQQASNDRYWMSERSVGEFQRTFKFSANVDQEGVRASLKDGILSVTVPKAQAPAARRIDVQQ
ncbi:hypothetical protein FH972_021230 [Carpinus fangiana]|uniref:SHSP domain-containing protein n=1 Tax=Carpinus fangiana TaxID=176857 RepID=A0A5N6KPB3_9ROSI|nr:hypothetical protein FH972_021230 [Carpinus fangiana]